MNTLDADFLCEARIRLNDDAPVIVGQTPWRNRRISHIAGGSFEGPKLNGEIYPGAADWNGVDR